MILLVYLCTTSGKHLNKPFFWHTHLDLMVIVLLNVYFFRLHSLLHSLTQQSLRTLRKHVYILKHSNMQRSSYLMTGFNLLQNFVVTHLFHVMKLLDLNRKHNYNKQVSFSNQSNVWVLYVTHESQALRVSYILQSRRWSNTGLCMTNFIFNQSCYMPCFVRKEPKCLYDMSLTKDPKWSMKCPFYHAVISSRACYTHYGLSNNLSVFGSLRTKLAI